MKDGGEISNVNPNKGFNILARHGTKSVSTEGAEAFRLLKKAWIFVRL
jgi:hypothetical protein